MSVVKPPGILVSFNATALGANFKEYRVYRRQSIGVALPWGDPIAKITVPGFRTPAEIEAQHRFFYDYEIVQSVVGGQYEYGFDYAVTAVSALTGLESDKASALVRRVSLPAEDESWLVSNAAPMFNFPVTWMKTLQSRVDNRTQVSQMQGRPFAFTRVPFEKPPRAHTFTFETDAFIGEQAVKVLRAAAESGKRFALVSARGDRVLGTVMNINLDQDGNTLAAGSGSFIETSKMSAEADYNLPCGLVLNGTTQTLTIADAADLDPAGAFTVIVAMIFGGSAGSDYAISKGNVGTADGYAIRTTAVANQLQFFVDGASGSGGPTDTDARWFDGDLHVATGVSSGIAQSLYLDDEVDTPATTTISHGAISNAIALTIGANNAGASGHMAGVHYAAAVYLRALTTSEIRNSARYLMGNMGYNMAAAPSFFIDLRDDRCWSGFTQHLIDLSGNRHPIVANNAPVTRGVPWPLDAFEEVE